MRIDRRSAAVLISLLLAMPTPHAFAAATTTPAEDDAARVVKEAGTLKSGMTVGADQRNVVVLSTQKVNTMMIVPQTEVGALTAEPAGLTFNNKGNLSASFSNTIVDLKASGLNLKAGDKVNLEFKSPAGSTWKTSFKVGDKIAFTTAISKEPMQITVSGTADAYKGGLKLSLTSIAVKYAAVEFMTARKWTVTASITAGGKTVGPASFNIDNRPGED